MLTAILGGDPQLLSGQPVMPEIDRACGHPRSARCRIGVVPVSSGRALRQTQRQRDPPRQHPPGVEDRQRHDDIDVAGASTIAMRRHRETTGGLAHQRRQAHRERADVTQALRAGALEPLLRAEDLPFGHGALPGRPISRTAQKGRRTRCGFRCSAGGGGARQRRRLRTRTYGSLRRTRQGGQSLVLSRIALRSVGKERGEKKGRQAADRGASRKRAHPAEPAPGPPFGPARLDQPLQLDVDQRLAKAVAHRR